MRGAQRVQNAPKVEVLDRTLREILSLRDALRFAPPLDQRAGQAALAKLDRKGDANRPAADDDDLIPFVSRFRHYECSEAIQVSGGGLDYFVASLLANDKRYCRTSKIGSADSGTRCQVSGSVSSNCQVWPRADSSTSSP